MGKRILLLVVALLLCSPAFAAEEIKVGSLNDLTGATSDVGKDMALGIRECVAYINDNGGINGKKLKLLLYDYGYRVPEAITIYKRFRDYDKIAMLSQWGTGDTEALSPTVNKDKMVALSDSFSGHLCDPKKTPYNFVYGTDYSTNARAALTVWFEKVWKSDKWKKEREAGRKPKLVCFYMFSSPYASAPIKAIKDQAELLGIEVGPDQDVSLVALDAKSQVLGAKKEKPTVVWHGNTTMSVATAIKDAYALKLGADHIINNWGFDQNLVRLTGKAGEGAIGAAACAFYGMKVPMMKDVMAYTKKINPGVPQAKRDIRTVQAWVKFGMIRDALTIADGKESITQRFAGPDIKAAFETFRDWQPFGKKGALGRPPVTYTATDHRPSSVSMIYWIKGGKIQLLDKIDMKKKFPDQWLSWLGW